MASSRKITAKAELELSLNQASFNSVQQKLNSLSVNTKFADGTKEISEELKNAGEAASQLADILDKAWNAKIGQLDLSVVRQEITKTWQSAQNLHEIFKKGGEESAYAYNNFASSILRTNIHLKQTSKVLDDLAESFGNTFKWGISSSFFNLLTSSLEKSIQYTIDLDTSLNDIRIVTGKGADEMERFAKNANKAAKALGASTRDYTDAALIYYQQGDDDEVAQAKAATTIKAANVTGQSSQEVSEQLTAVWNGFKVDKVEEAELYIDKLAYVAAETASDLEELATGMSKVASAANLMGVDVDQLNATLATVISVTRQAPESVGTAFKTIYARMGDIEAGLDAETTLGAYTEQMKKIAGIDVLDQNGQLRDMGEVIEEVGNKWADMSREQQIAISQAMAGTRQYNNLLALFDNWDMYTETLQKSQNAAGTLNRQQEIYMQSTEAGLQRLRTEAEETYKILFDTDTVNDFISLLEKLLSTTNVFLSALGGGKQTLANLGLIATQVFSNQIGKSLERVTENVEAKRSNKDAEKLKQEIIDQHAVSGDDFIGVVNSEALETEIKYAERLLKIKDLLSEAEAKDMIDQQKQIGILAERAEGIKKYLEIAQEMQRKGYLQGKFAVKDDVSQETFTKGLEEVKKEQTDLSYFEQLMKPEPTQLALNLDNKDGGIVESKNEKKETKSKSKQAKEELKAKQQLLKIEKQINKFVSDLKAKKKAKKLTEEEAKTYEEILDIQERLRKGDKLSEKDKATLLAHTKNMQKENERDIAKMRMGLQGVKDDQNKVNDEVEKELQNREKVLDKELEQKERAKEYAQLVQGISGMMNLVSGLGNVFDIITDSEISALEKAKQLLASMVMYAPLVIKSWGAIKAVWTGACATLLPLNVQMALTTAGTKLQAFATNLLTGALGLVLKAQIAASGANTGWSLSAGIATVATKLLEKAVKALNKAFETGPLTALIALIIKAIAIIGALTFGIVKVFQWMDQKNIKAMQDAAETARLQAENAHLLAEEAKAAAASLQEMRTKVQELTTQYEDGVISANRYKDAVYALAKQYGLANNVIAELIENESTLQDVMDQAAIDENNKAIQALENEETAQDSSIYTSLMEEVKTNENYKHRMDHNKKTIDLEGMVSRNDKEKALAKALEELNPDDTLFKNDDHIYIDKFSDLLESNPDEVRKILNDYSDQLAAKQLLSYMNDENVKTATDAKKQATTDKKDLQKTNLEIQYGKKSEITDIASYESARDNMVKDAMDKKLFDTNEDAEKWAEAYLTGLSDEIAKIGQKADFREDLIGFGKIPQAGYTEEDVNRLTDSQLEGLQSIQGKEFAEKFDELKLAGYSASDALAIMAQTYDTAGEAGTDFRDVIVDIDDKLKEELEAVGATEEELETYTKLLLKNNKSLGGNVDKAKEMALVNMKMNKGLSDLSENYEDLSKVLKKGDKDSAEYAKALNEMHGIMENFLNIEDGAQLSEEFYTSTKNLELMQKAAEGDEKAILALREAAGDDIIAQVAARANTEEATNALNQIDSFIDNYPIKDLEVGAAVNFDTVGGLDQLNDLVKASKMTSEEVQAYFNSMGYTPTVEMEEEEQETVHHGAYPDYSTDPPTIVPYTWTTTDIIKVPKITSLEYNGADNIDFKNTKAGKSGSGNKKSKIEKTEGSKDRYHDVNIELKQIANKLEEIQKEQEGLVGKDLIKNLADQYALLNKQLDTTAEKIRIAEGEASELQSSLSAKGAKFNADGTLSNYFDLYDKELAKLNAIEAKYDKMSEKQREKYQDTYDKAKEDFEKFEEELSRYEEIITDEIPGMMSEMQEILNQQIELKLEAFEYEIKLRLDLSEAKRDWEEFKADILEGKDLDNDPLAAAQLNKDKMNTYFNSEGTGSLQATTTHINKIMEQLAQMDADQVAGVYGETYTYKNSKGEDVTIDYNNRKQALEDLKTYIDENIGGLTEFNELMGDIYGNYVDLLGKIQEGFDKQTEAFETLDSMIQHDMELIKMAYGEEAYDKLSELYDKDLENSKAKLAALSAQVDYWKKEVADQRAYVETLEEGTDEWWRASEALTAAEESLNGAIDAESQAVLDAMQKVTDKLLFNIDKVFSELNKSVTGGLGLEYASLEWELIGAQADDYLDTVNAIYSTQQLQNKYLDAIEKSSNPAHQKKLNDLMEQETKYLREQDKLSQYDLDRANLKYELALKQIALEEAQQNKSKLRLRRDSQGNYTYQYTADNDQVASVQQEINDLYNQLYNLDADQYRGNLEKIYDVWAEAQEKMKEAAQINDPKVRAEYEELITKEYGDRINALTEENETIKSNLYQSTMSQLLELYNTDTANYDQMTQEQKDILDKYITEETELNGAAFDNLFGLYNENITELQSMVDEEKDILMTSLVPQWNSAYQSMLDTIVGEGGFQSTLGEAFKTIMEQAQAAFEELEKYETEYSERSEDNKTYITDQLTSAEKLLQMYKEDLPEIKTLIAGLATAWDEVTKSIGLATDAANTYYTTTQEKNADDAADEDPVGDNEGGNEPSGQNEGGNTGGNTGGNNQTQDLASNGAPFIATYKVKSGDTLSKIGAKYGVAWKRIYAENKGVIGSNPNLIYAGQKLKIPKYASGGYTGDWAGNGGQLAMLHKKELVLNAHDTDNMLNAITILRDITANLGATLLNRMASISAGGVGALGAAGAAAGLEQMVTINAEFPNVTNSHEIEDAINNLVNRASQHISK